MVRFDPVDIDLMIVRSRLPAGLEIQALLDAQEFVVGAIRGRLHEQYPYLTEKEINLKLLEELDRVYQPAPRFEFVSSHSTNT